MNYFRNQVFSYLTYAKNLDYEVPTYGNRNELTFYNIPDNTSLGYTIRTALDYAADATQSNYNLMLSTISSYNYEVLYTTCASTGGIGVGTGGGGSSGSNTIPSAPYLPGQDHAAIDPKKYTKCFDNIPDVGATYKVIVQVLEPVPGTSLNYGLINGVGHTAITLIKQGSNGFKVTQTLGFYPTTNPFSSPSKMVNNSDQTDYTIRMIFDMGGNATDFSKMLTALENPPSNYDLLGMNCTAFVVGVCASGGISLPNAYTTVGVAGPGGVTTAMTPGGLGYSLRNAHSQGDNRVSSGPTSVGNNPASNGPCN